MIRWQHPEYGMISPGVFIPLFEENGCIKRIDSFVWNKVAEQIKKWQGRYSRTIPVSVNVSRIDICDPELESELLSIVKNNEIDISSMFLEITESAYSEDSDMILETVKRLRDDGFKVEMDDFGSGYSSLNMLTEMPIDVLKLDMKFIRNICTNEKDRRMMELMIDIADFLNVPVVAEGVEHKEQYELLKKSGCDIIQGYYFSKPVPLEEFDKIVEKELM